MTGQEIRGLKELIQDILGQMVRIVYFQKKQQYFRSSMIGKELWQELSRLVEQISRHLEEINGEEPILTMEGLLMALQELQEAQESEDYVLLSDLYQLQLMPALSSVQERLVTALGVQIDERLLWENISCCGEKYPQLLYSLLPETVIRECGEREAFTDDAVNQIVALVEKCFEKGYSVEPTSCGMMTMAVNQGHQYYVHSNGQLVEEALLQAEEWLSQEKEEYIFYGLGLGYPYMEMLALDKNISVRVVETNREMLILAMVFAPLYRLIQNHQFSLIYDPTGHRLMNMTLGLDAHRGFYILKPALCGIKNSHLRDQLERFFVEESSVRIQSRSLQGNFKKNTRIPAGSFVDLIEKFRDKRVVIIAAGPSLDDNMMTLREKRKDTILLAAGTVLKKLLGAGIVPDYTIIIDAGENTYPQIEGVEECGVPLIFLSTAFSWIPRDYQGEKYLLCQQGFEPAELLAEKSGWPLVESGGSVMTTALDLCLRLPIREILFVGLDLALKEGVDHASETTYQNQVAKDTGIWVPGVKEEKVQTTRNLLLYLQWIQGRLARRTESEEKIPVIDATEGGALKEGMQIKALREALAE